MKWKLKVKRSEKKCSDLFEAIIKTNDLKGTENRCFIWPTFNASVCHLLSDSLALQIGFYSLIKDYRNIFQLLIDNEQPKQANKRRLPLKRTRRKRKNRRCYHYWYITENLRSVRRLRNSSAVSRKREDKVTHYRSIYAVGSIRCKP